MGNSAATLLVLAVGSHAHDWEVDNKCSITHQGKVYNGTIVGRVAPRNAREYAAMRSVGEINKWWNVQFEAHRSPQRIHENQMSPVDLAVLTYPKRKPRRRKRRKQSR